MSWTNILEALVAIGAIIHAIEYGGRIIGWLRNRTGSAERALSPRDVVLGVFYSIVCALLWSVSYVSLSYVSQRADPFYINVVLLGSATLFLFCGYLIAQAYARVHKPLTEVKVDWKTVTPWITAGANLANFVLFIYALYFISASQVITLGKTNPLFVAGLTWLWLKRPPPRSAISAVFLVVLGTLLITVNNEFSLESNATTSGSILAVLAGAAFAVFSIGLEKIEELEPGFPNRLLFMGIAFVLAYVGVVSFSYFEGKIPVADPESFWILVANGLRVAVVYVMYEAAVRRVGALLVSILVALEVPFTMLWDSRMLHHQPVPRLIIGAAAIMFGALTLALDTLQSRDKSQGKAA
jgi:drug/metabolite transporter (DMT)-like permease